LSDICSALEGIGCELEAANTIARAEARDRLGEDPLENTLYAADDPRPPELAIPSWVNSSASVSGPFLYEASPASPAETLAPPERGNVPTAAAIVVLTTLASIVLAFVVLFYWVI
jgi:hypothetical protein